ncbi:hypothetical protein pb186bvf_000054 [Paramecium bursaria]
MDKAVGFTNRLKQLENRITIRVEENKQIQTEYFGFVRHVILIYASNVVKKTKTNENCQYTLSFLVSCHDAGDCHKKKIYDLNDDNEYYQNQYQQSMIQSQRWSLSFKKKEKNPQFLFQVKFQKKNYRQQIGLIYIEIKYANMLGIYCY